MWELSVMPWRPPAFSRAGSPAEYDTILTSSEADPQNVIAGTRQRILGRISEQREYGVISHLPLTTEEVKTRVLGGFGIDEVRALVLLRGCSPVSRTYFGILGVTRSLAKSVLKERSRSRALQTTFCSMICATRLKCFPHFLSVF